MMYSRPFLVCVLWQAIILAATSVAINQTLSPSCSPYELYYCTCNLGNEPRPTKMKMCYEQTFDGYLCQPCPYILQDYFSCGACFENNVCTFCFRNESEIRSLYKLRNFYVHKSSNFDEEVVSDHNIIGTNKSSIPKVSNRMEELNTANNSSIEEAKYEKNIQNEYDKNKVLEHGRLKRFAMTTDPKDYADENFVQQNDSIDYVTSSRRLLDSKDALPFDETSRLLNQSFETLENLKTHGTNLSDIYKGNKTDTLDHSIDENKNKSSNIEFSNLINLSDRKLFVEVPYESEFEEFNGVIKEDSARYNDMLKQMLNIISKFKQLLNNSKHTEKKNESNSLLEELSNYNFSETHDAELKNISLENDSENSKNMSSERMEEYIRSKIIAKSNSPLQNETYQVHDLVDPLNTNTHSQSFGNITIIEVPNNEENVQVAKNKSALQNETFEADILADHLNTNQHSKNSENVTITEVPNKTENVQSPIRFDNKDLTSKNENDTKSFHEIYTEKLIVKKILGKTIEFIESNVPLKQIFLNMDNTGKCDIRRSSKSHDYNFLPTYEFQCKISKVFESFGSNSLLNIIGSKKEKLYMSRKDILPLLHDSVRCLTEESKHYSVVQSKREVILTNCLNFTFFPDVLARILYIYVNKNPKKVEYVNSVGSAQFKLNQNLTDDIGFNVTVLINYTRGEDYTDQEEMKYPFNSNNNLVIKGLLGMNITLSLLSDLSNDADAKLYLKSAEGDMESVTKYFLQTTRGNGSEKLLSNIKLPSNAKFSSRLQMASRQIGDTIPDFLTTEYKDIPPKKEDISHVTEVYFTLRNSSTVQNNEGNALNEIHRNNAQSSTSWNSTRKSKDSDENASNILSKTTLNNLSKGYDKSVINNIINTDFDSLRYESQQQDKEKFNTDEVKFLLSSLKEALPMKERRYKIPKDLRNFMHSFSSIVKQSQTDDGSNTLYSEKVLSPITFINHSIWMNFSFGLLLPMDKEKNSSAIPFVKSAESVVINDEYRYEFERPNKTHLYNSGNKSISDNQHFFLERNLDTSGTESNHLQQIEVSNDTNSKETNIFEIILQEKDPKNVIPIIDLENKLSNGSLVNSNVFKYYSTGVDENLIQKSQMKNLGEFNGTEYERPERSFIAGEKSQVKNLEELNEIEYETPERSSIAGEKSQEKNLEEFNKTEYEMSERSFIAGEKSQMYLEEFNEAEIEMPERSIMIRSLQENTENEDNGQQDRLVMVLIPDEIDDAFNSEENRLNLRRKRNILPYNDWCKIQIRGDAVMACSVWRHKKICELHCFEGYKINGKNSSMQTYTCWREDNVWMPTDISFCSQEYSKQEDPLDFTEEEKKSIILDYARKLFSAFLNGSSNESNLTGQHKKHEVKYVNFGNDYYDNTEDDAYESGIEHNRNEYNTVREEEDNTAGRDYTDYKIITDDVSEDGDLNIVLNLLPDQDSSR